MAVERNRAGRNRDRVLARLAEAQHGVASLAQLHEIGWTTSAVTQRVAAGRLHPVFRGVFAVGHGAIGPRGTLFAAVLACGDGSVVSHRSAAALWGLLDRPPALIDLIVPEQRGRKITGIRARRCRAPTPGEIASRHGIPSTAPARTFVDLAGMLGSLRLRRVVERAAVLGILDIAAVDSAIERGRGRRGIPSLRAIVDDWRGEGLSAPRLRSVLEAKLLSLVVADGLPRPACNRKLRLDGGEIEVDFLWPHRRLVVEVDGYAFHGTRAAFERDPRRDRELLLTGYRVVRFTWDQVEREPEATVRTISRLLGKGPAEGFERKGGGPPPDIPPATALPNDSGRSQWRAKGST